MIKSLMLSITLLVACLVAAPAFAASAEQSICSGANTGGSALSCGGGNGLPNSARPLTGKVRSITETLLIVAGAVAVVVIIIGGIRYIISQGDAAGVKAAKDTILYAVIGLVVTIMAYSIVHFVSTKIGG